MTISREQVADLQPGDVVELTSTTWPDGAVRGPLRQNGEYEALVLNSPCLGETYVIRNAQGDPSCADERTLTVVSRAPRPLYVNHPRTEPVPGDIVNYKSGYSGAVIGPFLYTYTQRWAGSPAAGCMTRWVGLPGCNPDTGPLYAAGSLRLLVDGQTGMSVPS